MADDSRQLEALYRALLSAFPTEEALEKMLRFGMGVNLAEIASGNLSDQVFAVIRFAEAQGLLATLLQSSLAASPNNASLLALSELRFDSTSARTVALTEPGSVSKVDKVALRNAIQQAYALEELQLLCADLQERCKTLGHDVGVSLDDIGGTTKPVKILNLIEFLDRRRLLGVLVQAVREQRPGRL